MADTPKIPTGRTKEPTDKGRGPAEPTSIGEDQHAGAHRGQNFQPRNAGAVEDSMEEAAARVARDIRENQTPDVSGRPDQDTPWEARVERGEEWLENKDTDPIRRGDINQDVYPHEAPANEPDER